MKLDIKLLRKALEVKQAEAATAWASFEKEKELAAELGPEILTNKEAFEKIDAAGKAYDLIKDEVNDLQIKLNRLTEMDGAGEPSAPGAGAEPRNANAPDLRTQLGERFFSSDTYQFLVKSGAIGNAAVQFGTAPGFEALTRGEVTADNRFLAATVVTTDYPSVPMRRPGILPLPQLGLEILDLLNVVPTDSDTIEWVYEKTFTNPAAETLENDATGAPEGTLDFDKESVACKWIPFFLPGTRQAMGDEPRLRAWIEQRLPYGVRQRLQTQIIAGDGLGANLTGITEWPGILTHAQGADTALADVIHRAKTKILVGTNANYQANSLLIHPNDYESMVLQKDGESRYFFGGPGVEGIRTIWGMLPVQHPSISAGAPIVCDIREAELYVREGVTVNVTDSHADFFRRGLVAWLASGRFAFAVLQPKAFCQVTFT